MIDNHVAFDEVMEQSRAAALRGDWYAAADAALHATTMCPDDLSARSELAVAFYHTAQYDRAIEVLEGVRQDYSNDLVTLAYLARAYEGNDQIDKAVETLLTLGKEAASQHLLHDALEAYEEAIQLDPVAEAARIGAAEVLVALGDAQRAAEHCVSVAQQRYADDNHIGAQEALDEALSLDPTSSAAMTLRAAISAATTHNAQPATASQDPAHIEDLVTQAQARQQAGDVTGALRLYREAIDAGAEHADVWYNLALLHNELGQHDSAIPLLRQVATRPEYALAAHRMLGNILRDRGEPEAAAEAFSGALKQIDLHALSRADVDDVTELYRVTAEVYADAGEFNRAASLCNALADALQQKRWGRDHAERQRTQARQYTQRLMTSRLQRIGGEAQGTGSIRSRTSTLDTLLTTGMLSSTTDDPFALLSTLTPAGEHRFVPVTPIDTAECDDNVVRLVNASEHFMKQGLVWAAIDACHEVIRHDVAYLPIHIRLGEIYERQGRVEDALVKYRTLIDAYIARECPQDAIAVYDRLLDLVPDDIGARTRLVTLLRAIGRESTAVDQAIRVAGTHFRIGQTTQALDEFEAIYAWAPPSALLHLEHGRALFKLERWSEAYTQFQQASQIAPDDPMALALQSLALAVQEQFGPALWDSFQTLLGKLDGNGQQQAVIQAEYRAALMIVDRPVMHYLLGLLQQTAEQHDMAVFSFEQALNLLAMDSDPSIAPVLVHQAMASSYLALDEQHHALDQLYTVQRLIAEEPPVFTSPHAIARPLTSDEVQRRIAAIRERLNTELEQEPAAPDVQPQAERASMESLSATDVERLLAQAEVHGAKQEYDAAMEVLTEAASLWPRDVRVHERLATLLLQQGKAVRGLAALETVAHLHFDSEQIEHALATLHRAAEYCWMQAQPDRALQLVEQGVAWAPEEPRAWQQYAIISLLAGHTKQAIVAQRRLVDLAELHGLPIRAGALQQLRSLVPDAHGGEPEEGGMPSFTPVP